MIFSFYKETDLSENINIEFSYFGCKMCISNQKKYLTEIILQVFHSFKKGIFIRGLYDSPNNHSYSFLLTLINLYELSSRYHKIA